MAVSQRFVPHDKSSKTADIFELMLDKAGPKDSFRTDWNKMSPEKKAELRGFMEDMHDKVLSAYKAIPRQLLLIFRLGPWFALINVLINSKLNIHLIINSNF